MTAETYLALLLLAFTAAFTPGPNNAMVAASAANFGFRRTLPHIVGIGLGFPLMIFIVGLFLGEIFARSVLLREALRWGGAALLLYIAFQIARSGGLSRKGEKAARPMRATEAAAFQWINPKGWAMAIAVTAQFVSGQGGMTAALIVAATFVLMGFCSASTWAVAGQALTRWLTTENRLRWFNYGMAAMIAASVVMLFAG
ncbi:LysE family translocator [Pseudoruegeria sp. SHC-113]|uniref:LysE family translocator n=1 Tax=Pseudoruegeria sp. SHC-113 TaxID=2855439 RepID=UPI0021BB0602|nr:LysE family translocator [Pseudoruegeria sp. SHC-113]MCT8158554.1 LysE family translocator [Pseudoruegeria sp. SHC-113]